MTWVEDDSGWWLKCGPCVAHRAWPSQFYDHWDGGLAIGPVAWRFRRNRAGRCGWTLSLRWSVKWQWQRGWHR